MGFSSQAGRVIFRTQAAQGTFQSDTGTAGIAIKTRGGTLAPNRELLQTDPEIGGGRDEVDAYLGAVSFSGDYEFYVRSNGLVTLLKSCLGTASSGTPVSGATVHTITPSGSSQPGFLSMEERIGDGMEYFNYYDVVVNSIHLECDANGYLMGTAGLIGARATAGITETAENLVVYDDSSMFVGTNVAVTYNGVTLPGKNFSVDINNNYEDDDFRLGSFYIGDLTAKRREITASFGIRESSSALWRQATFGSSAATTPGGLVGKAPLVITATSYELVPGGGILPYKIQITLPKFSLSPYALSVSGSDIIESDIDGRALRPSNSSPSISCVVTNGIATIK